MQFVCGGKVMQFQVFTYIPGKTFTVICFTCEYAYVFITQYTLETESSRVVFEGSTLNHLMAKFSDAIYSGLEKPFY